MDNVQFWIYLIIGVIYFLSRVLKKSEQQAPEIPQNKPVQGRAPQPRSTPSELPKQMTFEELLREITEGKQVPKTEPRRQEKEVLIDYDDDLPEEAQSLEEVVMEEKTDWRKERRNEIYEEGKRQAFARPSLEETMSLRDTDVRFGKFKVFETNNQRNLLREYTKAFQDPEGLKKAIVLSEILQRKF